jgi:hypothetical protein
MIEAAKLLKKIEELSRVIEERQRAVCEAEWHVRDETRDLNKVKDQYAYAVRSLMEMLAQVPVDAAPGPC